MRLSEKGQELPGLSPDLNVRHCRPGPQSIASPDLDPFRTRTLCYAKSCGSVEAVSWWSQTAHASSILSRYTFAFERYSARCASVKRCLAIILNPIKSMSHMIKDGRRCRKNIQITPSTHNVGPRHHRRPILAHDARAVSAVFYIDLSTHAPDCQPLAEIAPLRTVQLSKAAVPVRNLP